MRLLCVSDLHLDAISYGVERFEEVRDGLQQAVTAAIRAEVDRFVCLGDVCNPGTNRAPRAIAAVVEAAQQLSAGGIESWWLTGNHDVVEDGSGAHTLLPLREARLPLVDVVDEPGVIWSTGGCGVIALPYVPLVRAYDPEECVRGIAAKWTFDKHLVIGHLNIASATPGSESGELARGRAMVWPTAAIRERWPGALMIGGHYHKAGVYEGVHVVGSAARFSVDESDHVPAWLMVEV